MTLGRLALASLLALSGCGSTPDFACDIVQTVNGATAHGCSEIDELPDGTEGLGPGLCTQLKGKIVDACPSDGDLGFCSQTQGGLTQKLHFYSEGGVTAATAEAACKQIKGTWTAN